METELQKEFKQTIIFSIERKLHDLRSIIVGKLDKVVSETSYSAVIQGQNQSLNQGSVSSNQHSDNSDAILNQSMGRTSGQEQHSRNQSQDEGFYNTSKKISNDQELIQSDPISCPQNQKGNN